MKLLASIAVSAFLVPPSPGLASEADLFAGTTNTKSWAGALQIDEDANDAGPAALTADNLEAVAGMGTGTDFLCGAVSGAGLAIALSGVGAPVGVGLAAAGVACSMFL